MMPFRFGPAETQLYGCLHSPISAVDRHEAILLCNPFGQEAIRSQRLQRILAERLARAGFHVLRFDFFGTGDSAGDDTDGTIGRWCEDVILATQALQKHASADCVSWFGIRLGANIAALASRLSPCPVKQLVLWDPVIDGEAYLDELAEAHLAGVEKDYEARWILNSEIRELARASAGAESLGYPISHELHAAIRQLGMANMLDAKAGGVYVLQSEGSSGSQHPNIEQLRNSSTFELCQTSDAIQWASIEAQNTAIVPADAMQKIMSRLSVA